MKLSEALDELREFLSHHLTLRGLEEAEAYLEHFVQLEAENDKFRGLLKRTEHVHEWGGLCRSSFRLGILFECQVDGCDAVIGKEEILKRVNAAERWSAEDARTVADYLTVQLWKEEKTNLRAYADTLEGK